MVPAEDPGLSALGALVRPLSEYRVLDCFVPREKEPSSHQKRYGDAVRQPRVLYSRLQRYPDPYAAIGPGCLEVPQGATQAAVCCLRAATTGLEAWHLLGREKSCSKRSMPTLRCLPVVIVQVMDAIPKAGESHQRDSVSLTTAHPVATVKDVCRNGPGLLGGSEILAGRQVAVAGMDEVLQEVACLEADAAEVGSTGRLDMMLSPVGFSIASTSRPKKHLHRGRISVLEGPEGRRIGATMLVMPLGAALGHESPQTTRSPHRLFLSISAAHLGNLLSSWLRDLLKSTQRAGAPCRRLSSYSYLGR